MPLRMTGMTSGLDTDSIVSALMEAQTTKKTKVENKKDKAGVDTEYLDQSQQKALQLLYGFRRKDAFPVKLPDQEGSIFRCFHIDSNSTVKCVQRFLHG